MKERYLVDGKKKTITIIDPDLTAKEFHGMMKESWMKDGLMSYSIPATVKEIEINGKLRAGYYLQILNGWKILGLMVNGKRTDYRDGNLIFMQNSKNTVENNNNSSNEDGKLSDKQVQNWRNILVGMVGPIALILPKEEIQALRDKFQSDVNSLDKELSK